MSIKITKDLVPALLAAIEGLTRHHVLVGIPGDTAIRTKVGVGISNATLGFIHEFGAPGANIPARPFLRPGINANMPAIVRRLRAGAVKAMALPLDPAAGMNALHAVGLTAQSGVRRYINAGVPPALAPATLHKRKTRKVAPRTGEVPLLDTGQLRTAITYVIRRTR